MVYETILVPTDGSGGVAPAIEHALQLATTYGATVHALYVVDETESGAAIIGSDAGGGTRRQRESIGTEATEAIADAADDAGVECTQAVREGTPYRVITQYADEHDADVVVMSTRGRTGVSRVLLGSVTEQVVRTTDRPVLAVSRGTET